MGQRNIKPFELTHTHSDSPVRSYEKVYLHLFLESKRNAILLQSTVVLCMGWMRSWPIMPVHSKIPNCTFTFSDNPLLTQQNDS